MTDFNVGPGVAQRIAEDQGEIRSDEIYLILTEGQKISRTFATSGVYYYYEADNRTERTPF
jgi:hypothetical protein